MRHFCSILFAMVISLLIAGERLYAHPFEKYEFDSLAYLSSDVAEAEITRDFRKYEMDLTDIRVTQVFKGTFDKGQVITVSGPHYYRKSTKELMGSEPLATGDRLVVFLSRLKPSEDNHIPKNVPIFAPLPGGMRFVRDGRVCQFMSWNSSGPAVADIAAASRPDRSIALEEFKKQVRASLQKTKPWGRVVEAKMDDDTSSRMLDLLGIRSKRDDKNADYFSKRICLRFAESHNTDLLSRAMAVTEYRSILSYGFGTPQGREFLIARVKDEREPMESRMSYAKAIEEAGEVYRSKYININEHSCNIANDEADKGNSGYITNVARAARDVAIHEGLCLQLVRNIGFFGRGIVQNKPVPMMTDLYGSLAELKKLYDAKPSQEVQVEIEEAASSLPGAYDRLNSPCGPVISILSAVDESKFAKPEKPSVIFSYTITPLQGGRDLKPSIVFVNQKTKERFTEPFWYQKLGDGGVGGSNSALLPENIPHGRYHVFLEFSDKNRVRSTGHYFVKDL